MRWVVLVGCCCCCAGHLERSAIGAPLARALLPRAPPVLLCTVHREEEERNGKRPNAPAAAAAVTAAAAAATRQSQQVQSQPAQPQQAQPQQAQPQQAQQQQAQQQQAQQQQAPLEPPEPHQPPPPLQSTLESAQAEAVADAAGGLLDALDDWLREQTVASVLSKDQAKALLADLRDDRRFWAQQRRQFSLLWVSVEEGMRSEDRPLRSVLGPATTSRLLDALEQMDDDPALVNAVLRSEVVERLLGHVLYEGIFEFIQRVDLLGNVINTLPVLGVIRMQMVKTARTQLDALLGDQIARFLGEYTASAAESAATYLLSDDTAEARRIARRKAGEKVLSKPIGELVEISDLEMFLVRDAVWSAVQEFRLPHEDALVDRCARSRSLARDALPPPPPPLTSPYLPVNPKPCPPHTLPLPRRRACGRNAPRPSPLAPAPRSPPCPCCSPFPTAAPSPRVLPPCYTTRVYYTPTNPLLPTYYPPS